MGTKPMIFDILDKCSALATELSTKVSTMWVETLVDNANPNHSINRVDHLAVACV